MKCDLHGYRLFEAIEEIIDRISYCLSSEVSKIFLIHGYKHGKVLKSYIRSENFLKDMMREGIKLKELSNNNPGATMFQIL